MQTAEVQNGHYWMTVLGARSGNLFRSYTAGVSCFGANSTGVMRPRRSISAITLPAFVTASTTPPNVAKGFPLSVTKIDRPGENSLSVVEFFELASSIDEASSVCENCRVNSIHFLSAFKFLSKRRKLPTVEEALAEITKRTLPAPIFRRAGERIGRAA